jgi:hypothetical protein
MLDDSTLKALAEFPEKLKNFYNAVPNDRKDWAPEFWDGVPSETLTAIEQICHIRDVEIDGYHSRFERTLRGTNPVLESLDTYELAVQRNYTKANAEEVLSEFSQARQKTVQLLSSLTADQLNRTAVFEGYGPVTLQGLVHYLCSHDQQHLSGLQWLLGKIEADRFRSVHVMQPRCSDTSSV